MRCFVKTEMGITDRIVLFTSINRGGTMQFTLELYKQLKMKGFNVFCIIPERAEYDKEAVQKDDILLFRRDLFSNILSALYGELTIKNKDVINVGNLIHNCNGTLLISTDTSIFSLKVFSYLSKFQNKPYCLLTVHDVEPHPTHNNSIKDHILFKNSKYYRERCIRSADGYLLLSEVNRSKFIKKYREFSDNNFLLPLGAHIPSVNGIKPEELNDYDVDYYLFFGRLDKYKGIEQFLLAFNQIKDVDRKLIIAGNGVLTDKENELISHNKNIILIKRFISDNEMVWLFKNARAAVLPYIEASQSGIIPIAYFFGIPVVVSNIEGLSQYVINRNTGIVCSSIDDYINALVFLENNEAKKSMGNNAFTYYKDNLDWSRNLSLVLDDLENSVRIDKT